MTRARAALAATVVAGLGLAWLAVADGKKAQAWEVVAPARVELVPGTPGELQIEVVPGAGRQISRDGPIRIDVGAPDGVTINRRRLSLLDAADPGAPSPRWKLKLTSDRAGSYPVEIAVRLWLCVRQTCKPVRHTQIVTVDVVAPAVPDAAPPADAAPPIDGSKRRRRSRSTGG